MDADLSPLVMAVRFYVGDIAAAALGLVWIGGRILYLVNYSDAAERRGTGFTVQAGVCVVLLIGALAGIIGSFMYGG